ncbi:hypothetical protein Tco_0999436 [Tanacetum coccineum]
MPITSLWPFHKWGIDILGPFPEAQGKICIRQTSPDQRTSGQVEKSAIHEAKSKARMEKYYNAKVRSTTFKPGDFVYRSNEASHAKEGGKPSPKWEGPYEVVEALERVAYKIRNGEGDILSRTWNVQDLKKCYL